MLLRKSCLKALFVISLVNGVTACGDDSFKDPISSELDVSLISPGGVISGAEIRNLIHTELSKDKVFWESGRRSMEYRDTSVDNGKSSYKLVGTKVHLTMELPKVRIKGKFRRDRIIGGDKLRDIRVDFLDSKITAVFDVSKGLNAIKFESVNDVAVRKIDFEGEGLVLDIIENIAERREGKIRKGVERQLKSFLQKNGASIVKKVLKP